MIGTSGLLSATLSAALALSGDAVPPARRYHVRIGDCAVTALAPLREDGSGRVARSVKPLDTAFVVQSARSAVLVAPIALNSADRASLLSGKKAHGALDAIIITSLDRAQTAGLMEAGKPAFPDSRVYVDRALLDTVREAGSGRADDASAFAAYQAIGKLRVTDPGVAMLPGIKIAISPYKSRKESRVRIACGPTTMIVLPGREVSFAAPSADGGRRDERLAPALASDAFVVASTDGAFPGIGSIYLEHGGYLWGSIDARGFNGARRRRGQVIVETADDGPPESTKETPPPGH